MRPLIIALLALLLPATASAQETVLATLDAPAPVATYRGVTAWSERDPATGRFALVTTRGRAPVGTRGSRSSPRASRTQSGTKPASARASSRRPATTSTATPAA